MPHRQETKRTLMTSALCTQAREHTVKTEAMGLTFPKGQHYKTFEKGLKVIQCIGLY